ADCDAERAAVAAESAVATDLDAGRRERSAVAPDRLGRQRPGEIERMVHQVLADGPLVVAAVRHPVRGLLALGHQQQARRFDGIARQDVQFGRQAAAFDRISLVLIVTNKFDSAYAAVALRMARRRAGLFA